MGSSSSFGEISLTAKEWYPPKRPTGPGDSDAGRGRSHQDVTMGPWYTSLDSTAGGLASCASTTNWFLVSLPGINCGEASTDQTTNDLRTISKVPLSLDPHI
jgi:hypothetical protein